jgi:hypothetical protein
MNVPQPLGPFHGAWSDALAAPDGQAWLSALGALAADAQRKRGQGGAFLFEAIAPTATGPLPVIVKGYGRQSWIKDVGDRRRGTAAERAWRVAVHLRASGVGTPEPLAWLERWEGTRLAEAYFIAHRIENTSNGRDELRHLLRAEAYTDRLFPFMETLAASIRSLHEAGVVHGDLGNQNILMRRAGDHAWTDVQFIDLNRARIADGPLTAGSGPWTWPASICRRICCGVFFRCIFRIARPPIFSPRKNASARASPGIHGRASGVTRCGSDACAARWTR